MDIPEFPQRLTRWTVDRHYTSLVDALRGDGPPGAVAQAAKTLLIEQFRARHPGVEVPAAIVHLGPPAEPVESANATASEDTLPKEQQP